MDSLYSGLRFPEAADLWTSFFAETKDQIQYSNWRHLNAKRQEIENRVWKKLIHPKAKVLEIGCGKGFFLKRLHDNFGSSIEYYGLDISPIAIHHAQNYFNYPKYMVSSGEKLPLESSIFDYIQIISTLEHVIHPSLVIKEAYRVLKSRGYLYIVIHKTSLDPLLVSSACSLAEMFLKKLFNKDKQYSTSKYSLPLPLVRDETLKAIKEVNFKMIERNDLVSHINVGFYRKRHVPISFLLGIAELTNALPLSIFKNLEYRIYRK